MRSFIRWILGGIFSNGISLCTAVVPASRNPKQIWLPVKFRQQFSGASRSFQNYYRLPRKIRLLPCGCPITILVQAEQVSDGVICYADGVEASEIAILHLADEKDCQATGEALNEYIQNRASVFEGYAPQQEAMVKEGIVVENGRYIALLICPEPQSAKEAFLDCFGKDAESDGNNAENEPDKTNIEENAASAPSPNKEDLAESKGMENYRLVDI